MLLGNVEEIVRVAPHVAGEVVRQVTGGARVVRRHPDDIDDTEVGVGVEVALCLLLLYRSLQGPF